jgi:membrane fusion protein (multidrug efflux system)
MTFARLVRMLLPLAVLAALGAYAWQHFRQPVQPQGPGGPALAAPATARPAGGPPGGGPPGGVAVEVVKVALDTASDTVSAVGTLRSNESVVVRPEVSGRIASINFQEGGRVEKGAVIVALDASVQEAELAQARASLALRQQSLARTQDLMRDKYVSQSALDEAVANLRVAEANVQLAEAKRDKMRIRAPFAGVIGIRKVSAGDYVKEGQDLVTLEDTSALKVDFRVPEVLLARVGRNQSLELTTEAVPGRRFAANVFAIDPVVDENGRALFLRARLKNEEGRLRPGMFVRVQLLLDERKNAMMVPEESLVPVGDEQFVFRVTDGKAERLKVRTGLRRGGRVEIREGLAPGDTVVTAGQIKLRDGVAVRAVNLPAAGEAAAAAPQRPASSTADQAKTSGVITPVNASGERSTQRTGEPARDAAAAKPGG